MVNSQKTPLKIDKPIRLIELFAGVGAQAKALTRIGANFEHYKISEWEVNATASYRAIHCGNDNADYSAEFTGEELTEILFKIGISTDGKKPMGIKEIARKNEKWKRTVYNNFRATNNIGSILNISGSDLEIVDTDKYTYICCYSFPCQDLSLAGKQKGMAKGENTRSGLLWEVERLLNECTELPQILLMENVTQVHGSKNKEHFDEWITFLESKGYSNYWADLNSKNFGIPQNRNRTFMVSILGDYTYEFPKEFPLELRLKDMLEESVDEKFYISGEQMKKIVNWKAQQKPFERVLGRESISQTLTARGAGEYHSGMIVYSPENENTTDMQSNNLVTKIKEPVSLRIRKLTPKECWRLMGFDDADFEKAATVNSNSQLYKQAGNSIVVDVLCYIFGMML
jgi:DNA (cytosine-5)-methyltransferase 1